MSGRECGCDWSGAQKPKARLDRTLDPNRDGESGRGLAWGLVLQGCLGPSAGTGQTPGVLSQALTSDSALWGWEGLAADVHVAVFGLPFHSRKMLFLGGAVWRVKKQLVEEDFRRMVGRSGEP